MESNCALCNCSLCQRNRAFDAKVSEVDAPEIAQLLLETYNIGLELEFDRDYYKAIVDGSWPNADAVIAYSRTKRTVALAKEQFRSSFRVRVNQLLVEVE